MPTSEEIYEMQKTEKIWRMMKQIFEIIAMQDVKLLKPKIMAWVDNNYNFYNPNGNHINPSQMKS